MHRSIRRISAVLFDLDDTLLDWSGRVGSWTEITRPHVDNVHDNLTSHGHALPDKDAFAVIYRDIIIDSWAEARRTWESVCFETVLRKSCLLVGLDVDQIDFHELMVAFDYAPIPGVVPFVDTIPVLERLRELEYRIGMITNSMMPMWMRDIELERYALTPYFDVCITSGDCGTIKPNPAIYQKALDLLELTPNQVLFVGDRPANDIAGAKNAGITSVLFTPPHLNRDLDGVEPDYTITKLSELLPILGKLEEDR